MTANEATQGAEHHVLVDLVSSTPKRVLLVVANPTVSTTLGWPVGFWAAEATHPYYELTERGVELTIASPDGGKVTFDAYSDPRDESKWASEDLVTMGFVNTPECMALLESTPRLADLDWDSYDALMVAGGQAPMFTFRDNRVRQRRGGLRRCVRRAADHALARGGRPARARGQLHPGRTVQGLRRPRREAHHGPAAVLES